MLTDRKDIAPTLTTGQLVEVVSGEHTGLVGTLRSWTLDDGQYAAVLTQLGKSIIVHRDELEPV